MLRLITAATALTILVACDSEGIDRVAFPTTAPSTGSAALDDDSGTVASDSSTDAASTTTTDVANDSAGTTATETSDTGTLATRSSDDSGQTITISDDAGSSTSDGGQSTVDASADQISDDAASATSDGGLVSDDAGSSTSDGGTTSDAGTADTSNDSAGETAAVISSPGVRDTNAGDFSSEATGGDVIRVSSLVSNTSAEVCTTASDQNNFSDTRIGDFILHNNAWRTFRAAPGFEWEQCIYTNTNGAVAGWNYDWGPGVGGSADFYVRSYPELIYGVKDEFRTSAPQSETGLPVVLSELPNIRIDYSYDGPQFGESRIVDASNNPRFPNGSTISGERNVAVESFYYEPDAAGNCTTEIVTRNGGSNHTFEVMVWLDAGAERLPAGANDFVADLNIRGEDYKVYTKGSDPRYIAFVAQNPQTTGTIFWNDFADWARDNSFQVSELFGARSNTVQIQDDWCVANILVGTEIFWGAGNLDIFEWTITQSR